MDIHFKIVLLLICSQVFLFLVHITVLRILIKKRVSFSPLLVAIRCALFGNIPLLLIIWETTNAILYVLITYNILAYSYCQVFNMSETARRIRILYELNLGSSFHYKELADKYGARNMLDIRLERLMDMNQVTEHNGHFVLKSLFLYRIGAVVLNWGFFLKYNSHLKQELKRCEVS